MNTSTGVPQVKMKEALIEKKYEELADYSNQNIFTLLSAWSSDNISLVKKLISGYENTLRFITRWLKDKDEINQMVFELGRLQGVVSGIKHVLYCEKRKEEAATEYQNRLQYITHLSEIVKVLDKEGSLSHSDLSEKLHIKQPTLSEAMKKILAEDVITSTTSGKYKVYSLTDQGRHYARYLRSLRETLILGDDRGNETLCIKAECEIMNTNSNKQAETVSISEGDKVLFHIQGNDQDPYYCNGVIKTVIDDYQGVDKMKIAEVEQNSWYYDVSESNKPA